MYRVLVVDDEEIIRNGICKKIGRFFPELEVAPAQENAVEALNFIQNNRVDIVLVDIKMPMMDGLEFIAKAREHHPMLKFIVISGFKNFEYARTAITLGVNDYLLKPIDNDEFKMRIQSLLEDLDKNREKQAMESTIKTKAYEGTTYKKNRYLSELISADAEIDTTELLEDLKEMEIIFKQKKYVVITIVADNIKEIPKFKNVSGLEILQYAICNVIDEVFANWKGYSFTHFKYDNQFVLILNTDTTIARFFLIEKANKLVTILENIYGLNLHIGLGDEAGAVEDVCKSYRQSVQSVMQCNLPGVGSVCSFTEIKIKKSDIQIITGLKKDLLESFIKTQNEIEIRKCLQEIFKEAVKNNYANVKIVCLDVYFIVLKLLKENEKDTDIALAMFEEIEGAISANSSIEVLEGWLENKLVEVSLLFSKSKKNYGRPLIEEIIEYIEKNYSKDISLGGIAKKFFINTSYLSQLFKKEKNIKFIDYITGLRLEKAQGLLITSSLSVNEIAEAIGYNDARYFREVFVKHLHVTPSQYRKEHAVN